MRKIRGSQSYKIPSKIDVSKFDTFIIWCKPYKVPLAVATLR
ncbi:MAG: DM13 domain-containing protein [Methyloligellaceae bacterium]